MHYDFSLSVISRKPQQAKQTALAWCRDRGLKKPRVQQDEECLGWTSFSVFSSYLQDSSCLTLENQDPTNAFKELLASLQKVDQNVRVRSDWRSLEKYMHLEDEMAKYVNKTSQIRSRLDSEENKLNRDSIVHENADFDRDEEALQSGSLKEVRKQLKQDQNKNRTVAVIEA